MIMYNLLKALFDNGVSFVMTSNYDPTLLYPDGLHRDRMLPTIALLKDKLDVMNVDAGIDYRSRALEQVEAYYTPLNAATDKRCAQPTPGRRHRRRKIRWCTSSSARSARCAAPAASSGSISHPVRRPALAERLPGTGQPLPYRDPVRDAAMSAAMSSEARRFTWLIDVFYDHKVKLLMSAEGRAGRAVHQGRAGERIPPHGVAYH
jgi:cell division protein ZapE